MYKQVQSHNTCTNDIYYYSHVVCIDALLPRQHTHIEMHLRWNVSCSVHCLGNCRLASGGSSFAE